MLCFFIHKGYFLENNYEYCYDYTLLHVQSNEEEKVKSFIFIMKEREEEISEKLYHVMEGKFKNEGKEEKYRI